MSRIIIVLILFFNTVSYSQVTKTDFEKISDLRESSQNNNLSINERLKYAKAACSLSIKTNIDSTILMSNRVISPLHYNSGDYEEFKRINILNLRLATELNDSSALVAANYNLALYNHDHSKNDSAYYYYSKALKIYDKLNNIRKEAEVLLNIADIQETEKDYIGCEENAVKAIRLIESLPEDEYLLDQLWILHNLIGIVSLKLKSYDKALEYHEKASEISKKMEDGDYNNLYSINNEAIVYRMKGEVDTSIELYQEVIDKKEMYYVDDPSFYAITLGNLAYSKSLKEDRDLNEIKSLFIKATSISDTLDDQLAKNGIAIDFSKFYLDIEERDSSLFYANKSYRISKETSNNELLLESLLILSKLNEGNEGKKYLEEHIKLSDSLLNIERNVRNKYARIELETDELEAENKQFARDKLFLTILSVGLIITALLIYIVISQRAKNKELKLVQVQQQANEEIYNLMLVQQDKVDEARTLEKKRISEELHDGVLGRLFGARLSLDSLNFVEGKEAIKNRAGYIGQLKTIEDDIRQISHELNTDFVSGSGFMDIVTELIENQTQAYGLTYDFYFTDDISWETVSNKTKINIYRIIQESMQNIYKHANAKHIKISIRLKNNVILLDITDNGDGFDTTKSKKGIGLKNMTSRVDNLKGSITFNSKIGEGTIVNVKIPYTPNAV